jgi:hypothetical protein
VEKVEKMTGLGHDSGSGLVVGDYRPQRDILGLGLHYELRWDGTFRHIGLPLKIHAEAGSSIPSSWLPALMVRNRLTIQGDIVDMGSSFIFIFPIFCGDW